MMKLLCTLQAWLNKTKVVDFLAPLALRLYLVPIFWMAGTKKLANMDNVIAWFGNPEWGLGMPYPAVMAYLAAYAETLGAVALLVGLAVRWASIPLMITMVVAAVEVHLVHGWAVIAEKGSEGAQHLQSFLAWLQQAYPERYELLTSYGQPVILNNGIEFAATYFIMLLTLFFMGAGKYCSVDYWLERKYCG